MTAPPPDGQPREPLDAETRGRVMQLIAASRGTLYTGGEGSLIIATQHHDAAVNLVGEAEPPDELAELNQELEAHWAKVRF